MIADHYQTLGVPRDATTEQIEAAFKPLRALHPDMLPTWATPEARARATTTFAAITEARAVLADPARRAAYDQSLRDAAAPDDLADMLGFGEQIQATLVALRDPTEHPKEFARRFAAAMAEDAFRVARSSDGRRMILGWIERLGRKRPP